MAQKKQTKKILKNKKSSQKQAGKNKNKQAEKKDARNSSSKKKHKISLNSILLLIIVTSIVLFLIINIMSLLGFFDKDAKIIYSKPIEQNADETQLIPPVSSDKTQGENAEKKEPTLDDASEDESTTETQEETTTKKSDITLYYISITEDGEPKLLQETREIPQTPAILTASINELLQGSTNSNLTSYIPKGSKLLRASISKGVAQLDFNDVFQYNEYGNAGILAQLYQIVYTATEIPSIKSVQITIEGEKITYLGGEGTIDVSVPLTKSYLDTF